jgi:hypothetical protein
MPLSVDIFNKKILSDQSRFGKYNILLSGEAVNVDLSNYYTKDNPSGFITGVDLLSYATVSNLEATGANLQNQINNIDISSQLTGVSGYFQNQFDNLDTNYANQNEFNTLSGNLNLTGQSLNSIITNYSGFASNNFAQITGLNQSYKNLYISNIIGNNSTARIGSINLPYQTAQAAWNAISSSLPSSSYILNFYGDTSATANYTINVGDIDWPSNVGVRGIGPGPIALTITHNNIGPTTAKGKNFNITDWGYQSVSLSITSLGGSWAGGLAMNGGDGGDITLKNCLFNTITTQGGSASNSNRWGVFGSVNLDNCRGGILNLTQGSNGIGPVTSTASLTFINSDFNINSTSTNIPGTHTIRNCSIQFPLFQFQNANRYYKNTTDTRINTYYIDTVILSGNRVVKNFQISDSAILSGNLTGAVLHDNITGRLKSGYRQGAFVADFASGIYLYPFVESPNLVYNSGNQTISGIKTFTTRPNINSTGILLSGEAYPLNNPSGYITGVNLSSYATISNLAQTGSVLSAQINNLSGVSVLTYGNQTIDGIKTFRNTVYIHELYVTGTEFIANVQNNFIESPYILLNLTGGAVDGGIFFVTGTGLTGVNDYGPILGFDHTDKFKFGIARRSDDLSTLNDIAAVQDITNYSGFVNSNFYGINNPNGYITGIENIVYITGDQLVSGLKTFPDNINTNQIKGITGQFVGNSLSLIGGDGTSFGGPVVIRGGTGVNAGGNIQLNSNVSANRGTNKSLEIQAFRSGQVGEASIDIDDTIFNVKNGLTFQISGETVDPLNYYTKNNPSGFITGVDLSSYVTTGQTGNFVTTNQTGAFYPISNPSGFITGINLSNYVTKISGEFLNRPTVNGTGVLLSGEVIGGTVVENVVYTTGNQTISGIKTFDTRPQVNGTGILLSGEVSEGVEKRHDFVTGSVYDISYCGTAPKNALESDNIWNITKLTIDSAGMIILNQSVINYNWTGRYLAPYN